MYKKLKPLLKYPGGKTRELDTIIKKAPNKFTSYVEPFVGGGAVFFEINATKYFVNDISEELMLLYEYVKTRDITFLSELRTMDENWQQLKMISETHFSTLASVYEDFREGKTPEEELKVEIENLIEDYDYIFSAEYFKLEDVESSMFKSHLYRNLLNKFIRMVKNEIKNNKLLSEVDIYNNIETAVKSAYYMYFREIYNKSKKDLVVSTQKRVAIFFFVREYCFSSMFRFNLRKEFNVPYGGFSYNKKNIAAKIDYFTSDSLYQKMKMTDLFQLDFYDFVNKIPIDSDTFMFLDPPYDTEFSSYDDNVFDLSDQKRLANYLINECNCKFMLVIKKTDYIFKLYANKGLIIEEINKEYSVSFRNRNNKKVTHLMISNYSE